jgi:hypothetical protein
MPAALARVLSPLLHPIAARSGDVIAWYPARDIAVARRVCGSWVCVRRLGHDNAGALAGLLADGIISPLSDADARILRSQLPVLSPPESRPDPRQQTAP